MASTIICLATNQKFNFSRLPLPSNDPLLGGKDSLKLKELMDLCTHLSNKVLELESKVIDIKSTYKERIEKLEGRVNMLEEENEVLKDVHNVHSKVHTAAPVVEKEKSFKQRMIIVDINEDDVDDEEPAEVEEVLEVVKAAKLMTKVVTTAGATTTVEVTKVSVPRRRRGVVIQDPEETTSTVFVHSEVQSKDKGKCILIEEPKFQVTPKTSHLHAVKRIFRYLKGQPKLGLWYPKVSSFDLKAYLDSDYAGANLDRKSTTGVFHSKTKHIEIRNHFIRDAYKKKFIQVLKIHTDDNVADLLTKAFDVSSKELASPKQIALGKDISNSLMASRFPKTTLPTRLLKDNAASPKLTTVRVSAAETNAEIFDGLAKMGYEKLSEKLTFYKDFFSPQWKFLIHTILQCLSAKTTTWNEFSSTMASTIICLATNQKFNFSSALVPKQPLGMNLAALWHQQSFVLLQIRSLTSQ
nr:uncharacterized mitochondrial protein AtMg00810-like [Tanacetum cinerariifolium]